MVVVGVDFSGKFPDAPPCFCVAVRDGRVRCVLMTRKAKRVVRLIHHARGARFIP